MRGAVRGKGFSRMLGTAAVVRDESPPFSPDPNERVVYFAVDHGTKEMMEAATGRGEGSAAARVGMRTMTHGVVPLTALAPPSLLDGFNMESFCEDIGLPTPEPRQSPHPSPPNPHRTADATLMPCGRWLY